jgi:hypothetical protein
MQADDADAVARLVCTLAFPAYQHGQVATVEQWFGWLDERQAMETHPVVAGLAALISAYIPESRPPRNGGRDSPSRALPRRSGPPTPLRSSRGSRCCRR